MGDAGLDDEIGTACPDQFLNGVDIGGALDHRPPKPGEVLKIAASDRGLVPDIRKVGERAILSGVADVFGDAVAEILDRIDRLCVCHCVDRSFGIA